jgi:hypothetical protein
MELIRELVLLSGLASFASKWAGSGQTKPPQVALFVLTEAD